MKIDWQSDLKDAMWSMFWVARNQDGAGEPKIEPEDAESLKESVARLVKMTTFDVNSWIKANMNLFNPTQAHPGTLSRDERFERDNAGILGDWEY